MTDVVASSTPGTQALASLESDVDRLRLRDPSDVSAALSELRALERLRDRIVELGGWALRYPRAIAHLLSVIAEDPDLSLELAPTILACPAVNNGESSYTADEILAAAFPRLSGPLRHAAADRPVVRELLGIPEGVGYDVVPDPEPSWLWPLGKPFPRADSVVGIQARLNYLGYGAGQVNGEWNPETRRAFTRFQVKLGLEPTGEPNDESTEVLMFQTPDAPD
jgi:hypothetical protein